MIEGRLEISSWKDKNGENRRSEQVVASSVYFCGGSSSDHPPSYSEIERQEQYGFICDDDFPMDLPDEFQD